MVFKVAPGGSAKCDAIRRSYLLCVSPLKNNLNMEDYGNEKKTSL